MRSCPSNPAKLVMYKPSVGVCPTPTTTNRTKTRILFIFPITILITPFTIAWMFIIKNISYIHYIYVSRQMSLSSPPIICTECQEQFKYYDHFYYCCDSNEAFCVKCSRGTCEKCSRLRSKRHEMTSCRECYCKLLATTMYFDYASQNCFCYPCVKKAYQQSDHPQVVLLKKWSQVVQITCDRQEIQLYLKGFCGKCEKKLNFEELKEVDHQQSTHDIRCWKCSGKVPKKSSSPSKPPAKQRQTSYRYHSYVPSERKKCNACGYTIYGDRGFITDDFVICDICAKFSSFEENRMCQVRPSAFTSFSPIKQKDEWEDYHQFEEQMEERRLDNSFQSQERPQKKSEKINDQPQIVEDESYWQVINSPSHHNQKAYSLFKDQQQKNLSSSSSKNDKQATTRESFTMQLKKSDSFEYLEGMALNVEEGEKIITCSSCGYEVLPNYLIQDKKQLKCRFCFSETRRAQEKKQNPEIWRSSIPLTTYTTSSSRYNNENRFKTPSKKANEQYSHTSNYQENKHESSSSSSFYSSHNRNQWNSRSDHHNLESKMETMKKSETSKKSQKTQRNETTQRYSSIFDEPKCQMCLRGYGNYDYMGKKVCLTCKRKYMTSYR